MIKRRVIFVDDEPRILDGLRRMLRPMVKEWDMVFAASGQEALDIMSEGPFDVIVTDMRMPGMDGATLLSKVMVFHPNTVRLVLSGQSDKELLLRSVVPTHQFLAKPCMADVLKAAVERVLALRALVRDLSLRNAVSQMTALPALPALYTRVTEELRGPNPSATSLGRIVGCDLGMSVKVLQLVNSAFFGVHHPVFSISDAVKLLGLDIINSLVHEAQVFSQANHRELPASFKHEDLLRHSLAVASCAKAIARAVRDDNILAESAYTAGFLHAIGKLVLSSGIPAEYDVVLSTSEKERVSLGEAELNAFGCTHAEVGAYFLGLWGLPDEVIEAVAFHHSPCHSEGDDVSALTVVHIANVVVRECSCGADAAGGTTLDSEYLARLGIEDRLPEWLTLCQSVVREDIGGSAFERGV